MFHELLLLPEKELDLDGVESLLKFGEDLFVLSEFGSDVEFVCFLFFHPPSQVFLHFVEDSLQVLYFSF